MPTIRLREVQFHRLPMKTRFPFRYGIACMTDVPHLLVTAKVEVDGRMSRGLSADGLPPKWFTKNPETTFEQDDLPSMLRVIRNAADIGERLGPHPSFFVWWRQLYEAQSEWAVRSKIPPLLAGLGVSLIERAVLDALCRAIGKSLFDVFRANVLEIDFGSVRPSLEAVKPRDVLPAKPRSRVAVRHTIGLGDQIADEPVADDEHPRDGLPFTLAENIEQYGLRYFKIKLSGVVADDRERLTHIAEVIGRLVGPNAQFTLDGNENFDSVEQFREVWDELCESPELRSFFGQSLIFVEQPIHRSRALDPTVGPALNEWKNAPPIIIDESDADLSSLPAALSLGYSGTSHKNCKGIMKGLLGAATILHEQTDDHPLILSAEDLGNVGPIALLQDLAMVAALDIPHVERNGHHYFAGLSMYSDELQNEMLMQHADLYTRHARGFAALDPVAGMLSLRSVNEAPFGLIPQLNINQCETWEF